MLSLALPSNKCFPALCGTKALMPSMYQRIALLLVFLTPKSGCVVAEKACFYCTVSVVLFGVKPHSGAAHPLHQACCGSCASALRLDGGSEEDW